MNIKYLSIVCGLLLLVAIPSGLPYNYYIFLRWIVSLSSAYIAYGFYKSNAVGWVLVFGGLMILFNPITPFYLSKTSWIGIDLIAAVLFFIVSSPINKQKEAS